MACGDAEDKAMLAARLQRQIVVLAAGIASDDSRPGYSPTEWLVLSHLAGLAPEVELSVTGLARQVCTSKANASRSVHRLASAGLVECGIVSDNRRLRAVRITPQGRQVHQTTRPTECTGTRAAIEALPADELSTVMRILDKCLDAADPPSRLAHARRTRR